MQYAEAGEGKATRGAGTRRAALLALTGCVLALGTGCQSESRPDLPPNSPFQEPAYAPVGALAQGVAVGEVTDRSVLVWFRTNGPAQVQVEWQQDGEGTQPQRSAAIATKAEQDFTGTIAVTSLKPDTRYLYKVLTAGADPKALFEEQAFGHFVTAPEPGVSKDLTLLWSGDLGGQQKCRDAKFGYRIFTTMLLHAPSLFVFLGDTIYADDRCPSPPNVPGSDFTAATLDEYRTKQRYQRGDPSLKRFLGFVPTYVVWDDHEVRDNFAGSADAAMPVGRRALLDYWPVATPAHDPHRLYRSVRWGADVELFILDTRQYRSKNFEKDGPNKTMLGPAQKAWLLNGLVSTKATWKLIATSVPLSIPKPGKAANPGQDGWAAAADGTGFQTELQSIVDQLLARKVRNVVWLAADVHFAQVNAYDPDGDGAPDFYEAIAGPLSAAPGKAVPPVSPFKPTTLYNEGGFMNFGKVTISGQTLRLDIVDEQGAKKFSTQFQARGRE